MTSTIANPFGNPGQALISNVAQTTWIEPDDTATVAGRNIGDMVYIGREPPNPLSPHQVTYSINPNLLAAPQRKRANNRALTYSLNYTDMHPEARGQYLDWLASGRKNAKLPGNYATMYFFGLERKFFIGPTPYQQRRQIIAEVKRIRNLYQNKPADLSQRDKNHQRADLNLLKHIANFLDTAFTVAPDPEQDDPFELSMPGYYSIHLRDTIGRMAQAGEPLHADLILRWFQGHFAYPDSLPFRRALPEFRQLFRLNFEQDHPNGIKVRKPKAKIQEEYRAASGSFIINLDPMLKDIPDVSNSTAPLHAAAPTLNRTIKELTNYASALHRHQNNRDRVPVHHQLPRRIAHLFPSRAYNQLKTWAQTLADANQTVPIEQLLARTSGDPNTILNKNNLLKAAQVLAPMSIGMVPETQWSVRAPRAQDQIFLFNNYGQKLPDAPSPQYQAALVVVGAAALVAWADNGVSHSEFRTLRSATDSQLSALDDTEQLYLVYNALWLKNHPLTIAQLRRKLRELPASTAEPATEAIAQSALATAAADGAANPQELKALTGLFKSLNLPPETIFARMHDLTARQEPVTLQPAGAAATKSRLLPPPAAQEPATDASPKDTTQQPRSKTQNAPASKQPRTRADRKEQEQEPPAQSSWLDQRHIDQVQQETHQVSNLLSKIFQDEAEPAPTPETAKETEPETDGAASADPASRPEPEPGLPGLDRRHSELLRQILQQPEWSEADFQAAARALHLMPEGAIETINDWSYENYEDPMLEQDTGQIQVNQDLQHKIAAGVN